MFITVNLIILVCLFVLVIYISPEYEVFFIVLILLSAMCSFSSKSIMTASEIHEQYVKSFGS